MDFKPSQKFCLHVLDCYCKLYFFNKISNLRCRLKAVYFACFTYNLVFVRVEDLEIRASAEEFPEGASSNEKDQKIAQLSLRLLFLYHIRKSRAGHGPLPPPPLPAADAHALKPLLKPKFDALILCLGLAFQQGLDFRSRILTFNLNISVSTPGFSKLLTSLVEFSTLVNFEGFGLSVKRGIDYSPDVFNNILCRA